MKEKKYVKIFVRVDNDRALWVFKCNSYQLSQFAVWPRGSAFFWAFTDWTTLEAARPGQFDIGRRTRRQANLCALLLARGGACRSFHESFRALSLLFIPHFTQLHHIEFSHSLFLSPLFSLFVSYTDVKHPPCFSLFFSLLFALKFLSLFLSCYLSLSFFCGYLLYNQRFLIRKKAIVRLGYNKFSFLKILFLYNTGSQYTIYNNISLLIIPRYTHQVLQYIERLSIVRFQYVRDCDQGETRWTKPIRRQGGINCFLCFFSVDILYFTSFVGYPTRFWSPQ